jgi:hypothetical protein
VGNLPSVAHRASGDCSTVTGEEIGVLGKMRIQERRSEGADSAEGNSANQLSKQNSAQQRGATQVRREAAETDPGYCAM